MSLRKFALCLALAVLAVAASLIHAQAGDLAVIQQALNNDAIIKMHSAGLSDDIIVSTINSQPGTYTVDVNNLIALKKAGISDQVLNAMIARNNTPPPPVRPPYRGDGTQTTADADPNDPNSPHDPGIYMYAKGPNGMELTMLESSVYSSGKTGGMFSSVLTYGIAKVKMKAVIQGAHSNIQTSDSGVLFYFYFEENGKSFGGSTTPNEFNLLRFDVKSNSREAQTGSANAFGATTGTDVNAATGFAYKKIRPGIYQVTPAGRLTPGEYCFLPAGGQAGTAAASRLFAFGITGQ
jgi:hypothetical protein